MKVLIVDMAQASYPVKYVYTDAVTYEEPSPIEAVWYTPDGARCSYRLVPSEEEAITVDDSVEIGKGDPAPIPELLNKRKVRKIGEMEAAWHQNAFADFTCNATGHTYGCQPDDQLVFTMQATDILMFPEDYPSEATILWRTKDADVIPHTVAEFKEVLKSFRSHLRSQFAHLWELKNQVNAASTIEEVESIHW